ncbi:protein MOR1-like [Humulus lupulus]|uniref:protein MOR1-like n=1 Tax=Humulus lupulus TaxID=3486 RepID=UPI002B411B6A|nr:protein MOR1-like [Humulus lupulus]
MPTNKKGASAKGGVSKKSDAPAQTKSSKSAETPEDVEPSKMGLEEIESKLGSLVQADTISQLKSVVWKERLEAISSCKQQVEGLSDLDHWVELLISFARV